MAKAAHNMRQLAARRPTTQLLDPSQLPQREKGLRRVEEHFWRASAARGGGGGAPGTKRRLQRTLAAAPRKRRKPAQRRYVGVEKCVGNHLVRKGVDVRYWRSVIQLGPLLIGTVWM